MANPCGVALRALVIGSVVDDPEDAPGAAEEAEANVPPGEVAKVGYFVDDQERTLFVEDVGLRLVFDDDDLSAQNSVLVVPAEVCPRG